MRIRGTRNNGSRVRHTRSKLRIRERKEGRREDVRLGGVETAMGSIVEGGIDSSTICEG